MRGPLSSASQYARSLLRTARAGVLTGAEAVEKTRLKRRLRQLAAAADDIVVVTVVRDEALRLEYFFRYYRDLGVGRFFVLDHQSSDGTAGVVEAEPSAVRIPVAGNFIFKRAWIEAVLETVAEGRWCLVLDADEFLLWPHMRELSLRDLVAFLDGEGFEVFPCALLDMYPKGPVGEARYRPGADPLEVAPYFDRGGLTRQRSFGVSPLLSKAPLLRFRRGMRYGKGQHRVQNARHAEVSGVLLHFKFLQDFDAKIRSNPLIRVFDKAYGSELAAYRQKLEAQKALVLYSEESLRYQGPEQLLELGLMQDTARLRDFARRGRHPAG